MNILVADTTGEALSVALSSAGRVYALKRKFARPHDEALLPAVDALLKKAKIAMKDLSAIACASGPGRFTGIRIGMAWAAIAARQLKIPALAISRLEAAAWTGPEGKILAAVPGFRGEKFAQLFEKKGGRVAALKPPRWIAAADWEKIKAGATLVEIDPGARELIVPAAARLRAKKIPAFEPLYLKPAGYMARGAK